MVYKKIRNKIPSLSSLLLAGVLLGSSCGKDKKDTAGEQTTKNKEQDAKANEEQPKDASGKPLSDYYLNAVKNIFDYLVQKVKMIQRLGNDPYMLPEVEFQGETGKENLKRLCNHFSSLQHGNIYPQALQSVFSSIENLDISSHKHAYGMAFKTIADVWVGFSGFYREAQTLINKGAPEQKMASLLHRLEDFYTKTVLSPESDFVKGEFCDSKNISLYDKEGARLARFLTDCNSDGTPKDTKSRFLMPSLLEEKVGNVWINGCSTQNTDSEPNINKIGNRGAAMSEQWKVMGTSPVPKISSFSGLGKITKKFELPSPTSQDNSLVSTITFTRNIDLQNDKKLAGVQEDITFGQVLTTLFNGGSKPGKIDFINFVPSENNLQKGWIDIHPKTKVFEDLYKLTKNTNDSNAFATALGVHIENTPALQGLFCIPNVTDIINLMKRDIASIIDGNHQTVVNEGGTSNNIGVESVAAKFLRTLGTIFENNLTSESELLDFVQQLVEQSDDILKSDLDINRKIALKVIKTLFESEKNSDQNIRLLYSLDVQSGKKLIDYIEAEIYKEVNNAVVCKEGNSFVATNVTKKIQESINKMYAALNRKRGAAKITYAQITALSRADSAGKKFDIEKVRQAMIDDFESLKSILTSQVGSFLNKDSLMLTAEGYKVYFPDQKLAAPDIDTINNVKKEYMNQNQNKA